LNVQKEITNIKAPTQRPVMASSTFSQRDNPKPIITPAEHTGHIFLITFTRYFLFQSHRRL
jgi:hypothetical protein